jgi:hypothetical protein
MPEPVARTKTKLAKIDTFVLAARSPLHREHWQAASIDLVVAKASADRQRIPTPVQQTHELHKGLITQVSLCAVLNSHPSPTLIPSKVL